ncbi:hypothetical protein Q31b_21460 [Novipirellula aureliae]|uniref:Uncharacterized protein n=1 Tax=Novipirellula aureliae TaxID=2527966 RepID=A0A5C6E7C3_9BACT|nr:hypothetical protein [Novipirellula aureliae]TWU43109.1 hypothetical protein Q31b_21460 [Novipirellula aureliae]
MKTQCFFESTQLALAKFAVFLYFFPLLLFYAFDPLAAAAQTGSGYYTNPETGIVYRQVTKTIERPVVETKVNKREQTIYRPETVTETKPETRTVYTPVVEYAWEPRMEGRWNPFKPPVVAYHHVPRTRWESRNEVVHRRSSRTQWVAETRTVEVPQQIVRMEREQKIDYEPIGRVASPPTSTESAIASRLRPLDPNTPITPLANAIAQSPTYLPPRIAASTVGQMQSDPPRSPSQMGMPASDMSTGSSGGYQSTLPPSSSGNGIASLPSLPLWR